MQLSYAQTPRRPANLVDIQEVFRFVAPRVREATVKTADQLNHLGIRYALAGGLAVGADVKRTQDYLQQYASDLLPLFEELVNEALGE